MFKFRSLNFADEVEVKIISMDNQELTSTITSKDSNQLANLFKTINITTAPGTDFRLINQAAKNIKVDEIDQDLVKNLTVLNLVIKSIWINIFTYEMIIGYTIESNWIFRVMHFLNGSRIVNKAITEKQS